jgi:hypothetical protein
METSDFRHQCFTYDGSASRHVPMIAAVMKKKLEQRQRCLYFNSEPMAAMLRSHLAAIGVDVVGETAKASLVIYSDLGHLHEDQTFDIDRMMTALENALDEALQDGYAGLWTTGDVAWEFGPKRDFGQLGQYEMQLEEFLCTHPEMSGICQYHASVLPSDVVRTGREMHPSFFINETLSELNRTYIAKHPAHPMTATENVFNLDLPDDIRERVSTLADRQGITLNDFINQAIAEKLFLVAQRDAKQ